MRVVRDGNTSRADLLGHLEQVPLTILTDHPPLLRVYAHLLTSVRLGPEVRTTLEEAIRKTRRRRDWATTYVLQGYAAKWLCGEGRHGQARRRILVLLDYVWNKWTPPADDPAMIVYLEATAVHIFARAGACGDTRAHAEAFETYSQRIEGYRTSWYWQLFDAATHHTLGISEMLCGRLAEAERHYRTAFAAYVRVGERDYALRLTQGLAALRRYQARHTEALPLLKAAVAGATRTTSVCADCEPAFRMNLVHCLAEMGRVHNAAHTLAAPPDTAYDAHQLEYRVLRARLALAGGDSEQALAWSQEAIAIADPDGAIDATWPPRAWATHALALARNAKPGAEDAIQRTTALLEREVPPVARVECATTLAAALTHLRRANDAGERLRALRRLTPRWQLTPYLFVQARLYPELAPILKTFRQPQSAPTA